MREINEDVIIPSICAICALSLSMTHFVKYKSFKRHHCIMQQISYNIVDFTTVFSFISLIIQSFVIITLKEQILLLYFVFTCFEKSDYLL